MRRSTFHLASFRTADRRAVLLCIGLLLIVELGIVRQQWFWTFDEKTPAGVMDVMETEVIARAEVPPKVIVLGNSRMRDAVLPITLEDELGLQRGQVMNYSLTAGTLYDSLLMYRRNRDQLDDAAVAIIGVDAWYFRAKQRGLEARFVWHATLSDRTSAYVEGRNLDAVVGYFWRTFESAEQFINLAKALVRGGGRDVEIGVDGRLRVREEDLIRGPDVVDVDPIVRRIYPSFTPSDAPRTLLAELVTMLLADGVDVMLVRPPLRDSYVETRDAQAPQAERWFREQISRVQADFPVHAWLPSTASEFGWPQSFFLDYGHLALDGGAAFTVELGRELRSTFPYLGR